MLLSCAACVDEGAVSQGGGTADGEVVNNTQIGNYAVEIKGCRLAEDYLGKSVVIINFGFTNNGDEAAAFYTSLTYEVYQNGIGLNESWMLADGTNYSSDNQTKEIKTGATLGVEVAYELNDTTTDVEVEVSELFSFSDKKITKLFTMA